MKKIFIAIATVIMVLAILSPATALAASPIINGSFETGDYTGWTLWEGPEKLPTNGTWGIASNGEVIDPSQYTYDFYDKISVKQISPGLPITYETTDGEYLAYQLQNSIQDHRMYQDVTLSSSATLLSWDMFYKNHAVGFDDKKQCLAVHIRDLNDNILETLFITEVGSPPSILMTNFAFDISAYAGSTVRIDVEMKVREGFFDAGFDNFVIDQIDTYTITATAGDGGTLSPSGEIIVNEGEDQTFTNTPDTGYHIDDVLVNGGSVGAVDSYTFSTVSADYTIEAIFATNTYTITATAGDGGTLSPSGDVIVNEGEDQTFTITPDTGYHIDDVLVNGDSVGAVDSYTFSTVSADYTIEAIFAPEPPGWNKGKKSGWDGSTPPGLKKKDKTPAGFEKGNKNGWE